MARPLRIEYAGAFYHVINRGNAGENLFKSKSDREKFLEYIGKAVDRFAIKIYTYCLMSNHYHVLVETPQPNLSKAIQWINVSYATYFNRKRQRRGHLFQGRFKAILVDADEYLMQLSRYIHLNPVRAKMVESPSEYRWSSYPAFIGKVKAPDWLETEWLLSQFGKKKIEAINNYKDFVEEPDIKVLENPAKDLVGGLILGAPDFVGWVKEKILLSRPDEKEIPQLRQLKPTIKVDTIAEAVCREFKCSRESIIERGRKNNIARDLAIYLSRAISGETGAKLGEYFGNISGAGITVRYNHISTEIERNKQIRYHLNRIRKRIVNN